MPSSELSPRELAMLLLAAESGPPRQRARDQRADHVGLALRRQILERLVLLDPPADQLESALLQIVDEMQPPSGPARAAAMSVRDDLRATTEDPDMLEHVLGQAVRGGQSPRSMSRAAV